MKNIRLITIAVTALSFIFAGTATVGFQKAELTRGAGSSSAVEMFVAAESDVYGLQFEISYNTDELTLVNAESALEGYTFNYKEKENGVIRGLLFSMQGSELLAGDQTASVVHFEFDSVPGFDGTSIIEFNEVILAGEHGQEIAVNASTQEVTFSGSLIPQTTSLSDNYPNPFNPSTTLPYSIKEAGFVSISVYDLTGAEVVTLVSGYREPGQYKAVWNGMNRDGGPVASGRYIAKMVAPGYKESITMTLLK